MERFNLSTLCMCERKSKKLLGRGIGSTKGKTAGKGHKGAKARSGCVSSPFFEGGQTPLYRRLPKRGFNNILFSKKSVTYTVSISVLNRLILSGKILSSDVISLELLKEKKLIKSSIRYLKVLGGYDVTEKMNLVVNSITESARKAIANFGGSVEVL